MASDFPYPSQIKQYYQNLYIGVFSLIMNENIDIKKVSNDLFDAFETVGTPEGFDRHPRAYATLYLDNDALDFGIIM